MTTVHLHHDDAPDTLALLHALLGHALLDRYGSSSPVFASRHVRLLSSDTNAPPPSVATKIVPSCAKEGVKAMPYG